MPESKTKRLARELGLLRKSGCASSKRKRSGQLFSHVIVIDFESTCWEDRRGRQEVIEFPASLLDLTTGQIVEEFHQYVLPRENPKLSDFCKDLTGIQQEQVDNGIPLPTCLMLFNSWIVQIKEKRSIVLVEPGVDYCPVDTNLCALVSWSDWDLGVCLNYECQRKQIRKRSYFDQWIDIRALYKTFYNRKPSGLLGALEDVGLAFVGRQHCGLDDARNTAKLCYRLVRDGCKLSITRCIHKPKVATVKPVLKPTCAAVASSKPATEDKNILQCLKHTAEKENQCFSAVNDSFDEIVCGFTEKLDEWSKETSTPKKAVEITPVRPKCVNHVEPVTLLKPNLGLTPNLHSEFHTVDHHQSTTAILKPNLASNPNLQSHLQTVNHQSTTPLRNISRTAEQPPTHNIQTPLGQTTTDQKQGHQSLTPATGCSKTMFTPTFTVGKATPPLCKCGRRTKRKTVWNPGPNEGRAFFVCTLKRHSVQKRCGCDFFKWEISNTASNNCSGLTPLTHTASNMPCSEYVE